MKRGEWEGEKRGEELSGSWKETMRAPPESSDPRYFYSEPRIAHPIVSAVNLGSNGEKKFTDVDSLVAHGAFILCFVWLVIAIAR